MTPSPPASVDFARETLKQTRSRCPVCLRDCPAEVFKLAAAPPKVYLRRVCPEHGEATQCISSDARFYWLAKGNPDNARESCCSGGACRAAEGPGAGTLGRNAAGRGDSPFETLSTCLALIEIVDSCNLSCPVCYADSPLGATAPKVKAPSLGELQGRIQGVIDRKGGIEILQLSGGEPTLHPEFFTLLDWVHAHPKIDYVLLNTNGVRLAGDDAFVGQLAERTARRGLQVYLQFDGVGEAAQPLLRGADLRRMRERAIQRCGEIGVPMTLAMTVIPENLGDVWTTIEFGLRHPHIHGVTFQPMFASGRTQTGAAGEPARRLNVADVLLAAIGQSGGQLRTKDFTPLPCGDPNCATIGYLLRLDGEVHSVSDFIDFSKLQGFLRDKARYTLEDLAECGCESEPLGGVLKGMEMDASHTFRIMVKPFMDAWSWDQDRIDRCCTHVIRPDGKLDSFCRYYARMPETGE
jgi:uncharacterized radical SAM superfamily Fe-S cluster-containing enzyme